MRCARYGRRYRWIHSSFWYNQWNFANESGEPLVHLTPRFALMKHGADVRVEAAAISNPDLSLLTSLGWYLLLLTSHDVGGVVAASSAAAAAG